MFIKILTECFDEQSNFIEEIEKAYDEEKLVAFRFMYNGVTVWIKETTDWYTLYEKLSIHMEERSFGADEKAVEIDEVEKLLFADEEAETLWKKLQCEKSERIMSYARRWGKIMQFYNVQANVIANIAQRAKETAKLEPISPKEQEEAAEVLTKCWKYREPFEEWLKSGSS